MDSFCESMDSYRIVDHESRLKKIRFKSLVTNPVNFQGFACFYESNESLRILNTIAQNESLKIEIRETESLRTIKICTVDSIPRSVFERFVFVDSFCDNKNIKLLDSFQFVRIRIQIPHP
jgi:hypothetical protein